MPRSNPPSTGIYWPALPFYRLGAQQPAAAGESGCAIELIDGRVLREELVEFELGQDAVGVRAGESGAIRGVALAEIKSIKLLKPVAYMPDAEALKAVGANEVSTNTQKRFEITHADGTRKVGNTLGFVKEARGLFLFVTEGDSRRTFHCFVPASQLKEVQIGPQLGDVLLDTNVISADSLSQALNKQSKLRQEKIGKYLTDRAIISGSDLLTALRQQEKRPTVRLGDLLVEAELITAEQLKEALQIQSQHRGRRVGEILIEMGAVSLRVIQFALSDKLGIPYVNVKEFKIGPGALEVIPMEVAIRHQVLPLLRSADNLVVAVEDPFVMDIEQELRFLAGLSISPVIANPQDLKARIAKEYANLDTKVPDVRNGSAQADSRATANAQTKISDLAFQLEKE